MFADRVLSFCYTHSAAEIGWILPIIDLDAEPQIEMNEDEKFDFVAARILREHKAAFEELAKWLGCKPIFVAL